EEHLVAGKWTLFEFRSDTCATCVTLETSLVRLARDKGIALRRIDITQGGAAVEQHAIGATPTLILFDSEGVMRLRVEGDLDAVRKALVGK
ncbi:MAG: hypothetical protein C4341_07875, partial [Armatimonadota bacterium]